MKSAVFLAFFFLLFAFSTTLPSVTAADVVYDIEGQPLTFDARYHIIPAFRGRAGGLELAQSGNDICPITVKQALNEGDPGLPVKFLIGVSPTPNITEGAPLIIRFPDEEPNCVQNPTAWDVVEDFPRGWAVKLAYFEVRFGPFRIEKSSRQDAYKIVYCHPSDNVCVDLGTKKRRLIVNDGNPFLVRFKKVTESAAE